MKDAKLSATCIDTLVVFESLKKGEVLTALKALLLETALDKKVQKYSEFISALYKCGYDFSEYLLSEAVKDENKYTLLRAKDAEIPFVLGECVKGELTVLQMLSDINCRDLAAYIGFNGYLPPFLSQKIDFAAEYEKRINNVKYTGYGIYADNIMFRLDNGEITPVISPDTRGIDRLVRYENERQKLIDNTVDLVEGRHAANVLLYGDAGTGKSSTVKAVVNMLADRGLRLIEIRKNELSKLGGVMEKLRDNPLKFIIFIDDLSFNEPDDNFGTLKTVLEGSTQVKADNTAIYATSNRRHIVKESFADRDGDDVHRNDTMQELNSLSARFGLSILFARPSKAVYLEIVNELCKIKGITVDKNLEREADAFSLQKGGYTPRAAEQFVAQLRVNNTREEENC